MSILNKLSLNIFNTHCASYFMVLDLYYSTMTNILAVACETSQTVTCKLEEGGGKEGEVTIL